MRSRNDIQRQMARIALFSVGRLRLLRNRQQPRIPGLSEVKWEGKRSTPPMANLASGMDEIGS